MFLINLIVVVSDEDVADSTPQVLEIFISSPWYSDIVYVLHHFNPQPEVSNSKSRSLKLKSLKYCIHNDSLYWKYQGGVLLNCLVESEAKEVMNDFHKGDYGGHLFWKTKVNKILRERF